MYKLERVMQLPRAVVPNLFETMDRLGVWVWPPCTGLGHPYVEAGHPCVHAGGRGTCACIHRGGAPICMQVGKGLGTPGLEDMSVTPNYGITCPNCEKKTKAC